MVLCPGLEFVALDVGILHQPPLQNVYTTLVGSLKMRVFQHPVHATGRHPEIKDASALVPLNRKPSACNPESYTPKSKPNALNPDLEVGVVSTTIL